MRKIWALWVINLNPGLLRFSKWTKDFIQITKSKLTQIWIRLIDLPQEYWRSMTLLEIASAIGTPLVIDENTRNRLFGHYARVLVDIDLSERTFNHILVEREGFAFNVEVVYEKQPLFCKICNKIGHKIHHCNKIGTGQENISNEAKYKSENSVKKI